jgi:hypothetical protein
MPVVGNLPVGGCGVPDLGDQIWTLLFFLDSLQLLWSEQRLERKATTAFSKVDGAPSPKFAVTVSFFWLASVAFGSWRWSCRSPVRGFG